MTLHPPLVRVNQVTRGWIIVHDNYCTFFPSHHELMRCIGTTLADSLDLNTTKLSHTAERELALYDSAPTEQESEPYRTLAQVTAWTGGQLLMVRNQQFFRPNQQFLESVLRTAALMSHCRKDIFMRVDEIIRTRLESQRIDAWIAGIIRSANPPRPRFRTK